MSNQYCSHHEKRGQAKRIKAHVFQSTVESNFCLLCFYYTLSDWFKSKYHANVTLVIEESSS